MKNIGKITLVIGIIILLIGVASWVFINSKSHPFPLEEGDKIDSWHYEGVHKDGGDSDGQVHMEIERLKKLIDTGEFTNYTIYISIANQYHLLGEGEKEYYYLGKAVALDSEGTGLAWHNMGQLLTRLGALQSARKAFDNMVNAQPTVFYQTVRLDFLKQYFPDDKQVIEDAEQELGVSGDSASE